MATLHQDSRLPGQVQESDPEGALVVFESWDTGKYGLPEFHRSLFKEVCSRSGHNLKAFATILDDSVDEDQKADAGEVGITLIAGKRSELIDPKDDPVDKRWLIYHKSYYTALKDLKNINYVLGYAPFTAAAAADIRRSLFPQAKLYQINAVNPRYCADLTSEEQQKLEIDMLKIAEEADAVVSVGPSMYDYFENKYRAISNVSHIKLLPKAGEHFYKHDFSMPEDIRQLEILSFGAICARSVKALSDYAQLAVGIDEIASSIRQSGIRDINWNVIGIPKKDDGYVQNYLEEKMTRNSVKIGAFPECSPTDLVRWLKQCHMCLLPQSNINYGFMGLESIAYGVPTFLNGKSELSYFIDGHFKDNGSIFLVENNEQWKEKIQKMLNKPSSDSVCKQAVRLKEDFIESEEVRQSYDRFAAMFERCSTPSEDLPVSVGLDEQIWELYTQGVREEMKKSFKGELVAESGMVPNKMQELIQAYGTLLQMLKDNAEKAIQCADGKIKNLIRKCGHGVNGISGLNTSSLGMLLNFLGIVNLYRFKSSCENGRFARAFEPLLINDKMREIAERFNIPLKLKVTYNQAKFDAIDRFFCRRDGVLESTPNERGEFGEVVDNSKHYQRSSSQDEKGTRLPGHGIQAVESENSIVSGVKYGEGDINNGEPLPKKRRLAESMVTAATHLLAFKADKASSFLKHADMYLSSVFDILKCTTLKGQDWDFILVEVQTTEETQHILSTKQDILSLLGIREFLKIEMSSGINDVHGVAELFLESGRMIWHTGTPPKSPSLVVRSLIPYEASHAELEKYRMQYLLELGHAYCQEEIKGVIRQKEDAIAQLEENLMAAESRVKQFEGDEKSRSLRIGDLQDQFQKAIQEKASLQLQIKDARKEEAALKDLYKQEKERLEKACIKGKLDSRRVQDRLDKAVQEKGILEEKLTNAVQEVVVVKDLNKKQQNQLANANEEIRNQFIQLQKAKQDEATAQDLYQRKQQELSKADAIITSQLVSIKELESKVKQSDVTKVDRATCTPSLPDSVLEKMAEGISTGQDSEEDHDKESDGKTGEKPVSVSHQPDKHAATESAFPKTGSGSEMGTSSLDQKAIGSKHYISRKEKLKQKYGGSKWTLQVLGSMQSGTEPGQFNYPKGLAWHGDQLVICDTENHRIQILNKNKVVIEIIRFDGQFNKKFKPYAVAISPDGHFFITDIGNNQIIICDQNKKIIQIISQSADIEVRSITVMAAFIFVTDWKGKSLIKYNIKDGKLVARVSDQFSHPYSVMATSNNHLLVSDFNKHVIHVLDSDLNFLNSYRNDRLKTPRGLDVDSHGNIYICREWSNGIVKLRSDGQLDCVLFEDVWYYPEFIAVNDDITTIAVTQWSYRSVHQIGVYSVSTFFNKFFTSYTPSLD